MKRGRKRAVKGGRSGNAGIVASFAIALAGIALGAVSAYVSEKSAVARAGDARPAAIALRDAPAGERAWRERQKIVELVLSGDGLERLPAPPAFSAAPPRPKIVIVFDDMGLDRRAFEQVSQLPGPLTLSFLPYANGVDALAELARGRGAEVMLHLPMEPEGGADPGPHALKADMTGVRFIKELEWNLGQISGVVGVNNHMGSKLTADEAAMKTVLAYLKQQDLFFLDSVTTGDTVARAAGGMVGAQVFSRDVFLDAETNDAKAIRARLVLVERIARETGYAVAICHPRKETIEALGPWLATAPYRGFDLVPASALVDIERALVRPVMAQAPTLRL